MSSPAKHLKETSTTRGFVMAGALGDCVHVAGVYRFLQLAAGAGYQTLFMGPAVSVERFVGEIKRVRPTLVGISYRLSPEAGERLLSQLRTALDEQGLLGIGIRYTYGGTPPAATVAKDAGWFEAVFDGSEDDSRVISYLRGELLVTGRPERADNLVDRIARQAPYPIIRHHFGLPAWEDTLRGIAEIAESKQVDVISIAPDQNAQSCFFRQGEMQSGSDGAGGVPIRTPDQFRQLYEASRRGNYPLLRCYSGTRDLIPMGKVLRDTIHNAWAAIPLFWYSRLDGRSNRPLREAIEENIAAIHWHAEQGISVEVNDPHQWSLRDAPDAVAVAVAFLSAYNARQAGVRRYVQQFMFDTPAGTSPAMDLAKQAAAQEMVAMLENERFSVTRETRTGLLSLPLNMDLAKGHLAASVLMQMHLKPHILHVVAHCEAHHAATPEDIVEAVQIARGAVRRAMDGLPDAIGDSVVQARKAELMAEARLLLEDIRRVSEPGVADPWSDPATLARAVQTGILDAPHLAGNSDSCGAVTTRMVKGACRSHDCARQRSISEEERLADLRRNVRKAAGLDG